MKKIIFLTIGLWGLLTGCQNEEDSGISAIPRKDIVLSRSEMQMTRECTDFAFRLFSEVNKVKEGNFMVSPLSASMTLGMITNGADGKTLEELKEVLGVGETTEEMNLYFNKLITELSVLDNTTTMQLANSIWIDNSFNINNEFEDINRKMYNAEIKSIDFTSPNALSTINNWFSEKTNGKIKEGLGKISPDDDMYLINAFHFKGKWKNEFLQSGSFNKDFNNEDGSTTLVKMMSQTNEFGYTDNEYFSLAEFPYGNEAFSMVILLPKQESSLNESLGDLTLENWLTWSSELDTQELIVNVPRFELSGKDELDEAFKNMGIKDAMDKNASDFTRMGTSTFSDRLSLSRFEQSSYIEVNENGTEVASGSIGVMGDIIAPPHTSFIVDRPFAFLIKEKSTGVILLMGKVVKL